MKKNTNWNGVTSFEESPVGFGTVSPPFFNKRAHSRIKGKDLSALLEREELLVQINTETSTFTDHLINISKGGIAMSLPELLAINLPVKVDFFLGTKRIISNANIRQTYKTGEQYMTGIMFADLAKDSAEYIDGSIRIKEFISSLDIENLPQLLFYEQDSEPSFLGNFLPIKAETHILILD